MKSDREDEGFDEAGLIDREADFSPFGSYCPHFISDPVMTQRWDDVLFVSWPVAVDQLAARLPAGLWPDEWNGSAWVSLVPFMMRDSRYRDRRLPTGSFPEVNVRAYVVGPEGPGVWFASLDVPSLLPKAVANRVYGLNYRWSRVTVSKDANWVDWSVRRRPRGPRGHVRGHIGQPVSPTGLDQFLTARWRLYAGRKGLVTARVEHRPWELHEATVEGLDLGLVNAAGLHPRNSPWVRWSPGTDVTVERPVSL